MSVKRQNAKRCWSTSGMRQRGREARKVARDERGGGGEQKEIGAWELLKRFVPQAPVLQG